MNVIGDTIILSVEKYSINSEFLPALVQEGKKACLTHVKEQISKKSASL